jgi:hypothetical protein
MNRTKILTVLALVLLAMAAPARVIAAEVTGKYLEARTCDIWTGPCFANAEMNLAGKHAILAWKIDKGTLDNVKLDGLGIVAVVAASDTLGCEQNGKAKAVLIIDTRANKDQKSALIRLAKKQGGALVENVVRVQSAKIELDMCPCKENGCAVLKAGDAKIETRCLDAKHDKVCGNESAFYPPLAKNVKVKPAMAVENSYQGKGAGAKWNDAGRRGAYLGSFTAR